MRLDDTGFFLHTTGADSPFKFISAGDPGNGTARDTRRRFGVNPK
jgi:hypothetical protein